MASWCCATAYPPGQVTSAAWAETLGACAGLAYVWGPAGAVVDRDWVRAGSYEVDVNGVREPVGRLATATVRPGGTEDPGLNRAERAQFPSEWAVPSIFLVALIPMAFRIVGITSVVRKVSPVEAPCIPGDQNTIGTRCTLCCAPPWSPYTP